MSGDVRALYPEAANSFSEYAPEPNPETMKRNMVWFALNDDRSVAAFGPNSRATAP